jgi:hypothetical protein
MRNSMFKFELVSSEGDSLESLEKNKCNWQPGETISGPLCW